MRVKVNGVICSDDDAEVYRWYNIAATCPRDIRDAVKRTLERDNLVLEINSGGGSVYAAFEIYSILRSTQTYCIAEVQSLAGSAASIIMVGAHRARISPVGQVMIHLPSTSTDGDKRDHGRTIQILETVEQSIIEAYAQKCKDKATTAKIREYMENETYLTAEQAREIGLVDDILYGTTTEVYNMQSVMPDIIQLRSAYQAQQMGKIGRKTQIKRIEDEIKKWEILAK